MKWAVLVCSSDKYKDLALPYEKNFYVYWPDCDLEVYFLTNKEKINFERFNNIRSGEVHSWSEALSAGLTQISADYLIVTLEDAFLSKNVDNKVIDRAKNFLVNEEIGCLHPRPIPRPKQNEKFCLEFSKYQQGIPYALNVFGFWNIEVLKKCLIKGESAQEFEVKGNYRFNQISNAACSNQNIFSTLHLVEKGQWVPNIKSIVKKYDLDIDLGSRVILSRRRLIKYFYLKIHFFLFLNYVPLKFRQRAIRFFEKALVIN
jgi:hypothetical protein